MRKLLYILYQPYKFLVFMPLMGVLTLLFSMLAMVLAMVAGQRVGGMAGIWWAKCICLITPVRVSAEGLENIDRKQSYVVVSNHQSHFDVLVLYASLMMDLKWVMKKELRKAPGMGIACEKLGFIYVDRKDSAAARAAIEEAKGRIKDGTCVMFFPEGTRSITGELTEFKKGAFNMALDLGLPILPVTVTGTRKVLPPTSLNLYPGSAQVTVHQPVEIDGFTKENIVPLIEKVKGVIATAL